MNVLPILKDDFVEICYNMRDGNLRKVNFKNQATVVAYKVPPNYGGYATVFPDRVDKTKVGTSINLMRAQELAEKDEKMRVYPGSIEVREGENFALGSRTICVVGLGYGIQEAREKSLEGLGAIRGGALWNRKDIGAEAHIERSIKHMEKLRRR